jgi:hypothetical protein
MVEQRKQREVQSRSLITRYDGRFSSLEVLTGAVCQMVCDYLSPNREIRMNQEMFNDSVINFDYFT